MYNNNIISENYKQNLYNVANIIPTLFLIINLIFTIHLFNENKNINSTIWKNTIWRTKKISTVFKWQTRIRNIKMERAVLRQ